MLTVKSLNFFPSSIIRIEVDFEELRRYVKGVFEEEYGTNSVTKVEATQYSPDMINVTIYVREKKADMWDLCTKIAHILRSQGIRAGVRMELTQD